MRHATLLLLFLALIAPAGCGSEPAAGEPTLVVYLSAPLLSGSADLPQDTIDAAGLAFDDAGYEAGGVEVELEVLTGSDPRADPATTAVLNARTAARDSTAIAYIGETLPEATRSSILVTEAAGIPQVAPSALEAAPDEEFESRFEAEFGRPPGRGSRAAFAAAELVLEAIDQAEDPLDRASVMEALSAAGYEAG